MPCSRPSQRPSAAARSASAALAKAASSSHVTTAFSVSLWRWIFSIQASVAATAEGVMLDVSLMSLPLREAYEIIENVAHGTVHRAGVALHIRDQAR